MKKINLRIVSIFILLTIFIANMSFASYENVTMSIVSENVCTIDIGENSHFEKKLISKNLQNKEVTLQLKVSNEEIVEQPSGEIMVVVDNSNSMNDIIAGSQTRADLIKASAKKLISGVLSANKNLKIGIVSFSTNVDVSKEGTLEDATVISNLSNNSSELSNAIDKIEQNGPRTDLDAGLTLANQSFSTEKNNKFMIVLTDGVPNVAIDYDKSYYSDDVIAKTKSKLQQISTSGINILTMLSGISDPNYIPATTSKSFGQIIEEIFGTPQTPTAGVFYYISDNDIEKTIAEDIYKALVPKSKTLKNITITDYFPKEIVDNFDFAYVKEANIGNISAEVDKTNNSITWTIPELEVGKTALVEYTLKLKQNYSSSIVNVVLNTNQKIDINYTDYNNKTESKTSDVSPQIKLEEPAPVLPKAGTTMMIIAFISAGGLLIFSFARMLIINNKLK